MSLNIFRKDLLIVEVFGNKLVFVVQKIKYMEKQWYKFYKFNKFFE